MLKERLGWDFEKNISRRLAFLFFSNGNISRSVIIKKIICAKSLGPMSFASTYRLFFKEITKNVNDESLKIGRKKKKNKALVFKILNDHDFQGKSQLSRVITLAKMSFFVAIKELP